VTWQVVTFVLVMLVIGTGLVWYERTRPPSQVVALVALLAALAVVGRVLLAPLPNVVATTDIVLIAGYVLGPAPGFAVGALGGLVSNFWLGQGIWTPWQMVAWGMTGVGGALLWKLTGGQAGRVRLALACGLAGLLFGMWMNLQFLVGFGGEVTAGRYLALQVRSIPFDLAHIAGNVLFALAAGPALVAALRRFRERFEWSRVPGTVGAVAIAVALSTVMLAPAPAEANLSDQARKARAWLEGSQNRNGGFGTSRNSESSVTITARAAIGFAAAGRNPFDVTRSGRSPIGYLTSQSKAIKSPGDISLTILALHSAGADPRKFAGRNLVAELDSKRRRDRTFGDRVNVAAWAALALRAAKAGGAASAVVDWLVSVQGPGNQGWGISSGAASDPDSTGTVLQLLGRGGRADRALTWLAGIQRGSGGFSGMNSVPTVNTQSTGLVLQGLAGLGYRPGKLTKDGRTGLDFLKARQRASGAVDYSAGNDQTPVWVTADALVALSGKSLPVTGPRRKPVVPSSNEPSGGGTSPGSGGGSGGSSGGTSGGSGSGGDSGSGPDSRAPGDSSDGPGFDEVPVPGGDSLVPDGVSPFATTPVAPSAELLEASRAGPSPSAALAVLIGLGAAILITGATTFLVRRKRW
jgi:energy-coupling factor transport system substrate-specific component